MKNPWMSAWLSAANKAAGPMRGAWAAEASKQRKVFMDQWMKAWTSGLTAMTEASKKRGRGK